jgi:hypothetical protein
MSVERVSDAVEQMAKGIVPGRTPQ